MTSSLSRSEKEGYLLVEFRYGDPFAPQYARYTDWGQNTSGYVSTEGLEVDVPDNLGTFGEKEARVTMPLDAFTSEVSSGLPHSPIFLTVTEITAGLFPGDASHQLVVFKGRVVRSIKNFEGANDSVALFATPIKSQLDVPMGYQCNHTCNHSLFRNGCGNGRQEVNHRIFGQIAAIDGQEITVSANAGLTAPTSPGGNVDRYWERGFLEKDGLQIGIRIWVLTDPTIFILRRRPPNSWLLAGSSSIKFVPGCHKSIEDCRAVWDNESEFLGLGHSMLAYNPLFENPAG